MAVHRAMTGSLCSACECGKALHRTFLPWFSPTLMSPCLSRTPQRSQAACSLSSTPPWHTWAPRMQHNTSKPAIHLSFSTCVACSCCTSCYLPMLLFSFIKYMVPHGKAHDTTCYHTGKVSACTLHVETIYFLRATLL